MGRRIEFLTFLNRFISNVFWLNLKRFRQHIFWRILLTGINFMMLLSAVLSFTGSAVSFIFILVTLSNILFIVTRIHSEKSSILLLRSFGASRIFIITDHLLQILIEIFLAGIAFLFVLPFRKTTLLPLELLLLQIIIISAVTLIISYLSVQSLEREKKEA